MANILKAFTGMHRGDKTAEHQLTGLDAADGEVKKRPPTPAQEYGVGNTVTAVAFGAELAEETLAQRFVPMARYVAPVGTERRELNAPNVGPRPAILSPAESMQQHLKYLDSLDNFRSGRTF